MTKEIEAYLEELEWELSDMAPSMVEDALADAQVHLYQAMTDARRDNPDQDDASLAQTVIADFGQPAEIAQAYRVIETEQLTEEQGTTTQGTITKIGRFITIYRDWRTLTAEVRIGPDRSTDG